jgi:hypothetical protein
MIPTCTELEKGGAVFHLREVATFQRCPDSTEVVILNLGNFLSEYNHQRRHGGLNYVRPFDKLEKVTKLLS